MLVTTLKHIHTHTHAYIDQLEYLEHDCDKQQTVLCTQWDRERESHQKRFVEHDNDYGNIDPCNGTREWLRQNV